LRESVAARPPGAGGGLIVNLRRTRKKTMRSILLMFLGVPLPIILLLAFCTHHF
jgi:hypothetical protein